MRAILFTIFLAALISGGLIPAMAQTDSIAVDSPVIKKGCVTGNCRSGSGVFVFSNGDKYIGPFRKGKREGKGRDSLMNGQMFIGRFLDDQRNGPGEIHFPNGDVLTGWFLDTVIQGSVKIRYADSTTYEGGFKNGKREGHGTLTSRDGSRYDGEFHNGMPDGEGIMYLPRGEIKRGIYSRGVLTQEKDYNWAPDTSGEGEFCRSLKLILASMPKEFIPIKGYSWVTAGDTNWAPTVILPGSKKVAISRDTGLISSHYYVEFLRQAPEDQAQAAYTMLDRRLRMCKPLDWQAKEQESSSVKTNQNDIHIFKIWNTKTKSSPGGYRAVLKMYGTGNLYTVGLRFENYEREEK